MLLSVATFLIWCAHWQGAEIDWSNPECWHWTALHEACANGHAEAAELLIRHGAALEKVGKRNQTALHLASAAGENDVVETLLRHGANIHALDAHGEAFIDLADNALLAAMLSSAATEAAA